MNILLYTPKEFEQWRAALQTVLPDARVFSHEEKLLCDYAVLWKPPAQLLRALDSPKAIFSLGAGVDGLLAMPDFPRQVALYRMEDVGMAAQMSEYALYCALRQFRRFGDYAEYQRQGQWTPEPFQMRADYRIGVLGLGVLGAQVAQDLAQFGFSVSGWSRTPKSLAGIDCYHGEAGLKPMLAKCELLIALLPLTRDTHGLLNRERLALLPPGAALVNLARGQLLDEADLLQALNRGQLSHAYLDVFASEPLPENHPFWAHGQISITPHIAALTPYTAAAAQVAHKIRQLQAGEAASGRVDGLRGY